MVKKFNYICDFNGTKHPVTFYVGHAAKDSHPIGFQAQWLSKTRGGKVPKELMDALEKIKELADAQKVPFDELCEYVLDEMKITDENFKSISDSSKVDVQEKKLSNPEQESEQPVQSNPANQSEKQNN